MSDGTNFKELLVLPDNLIWSWRKAKALYQASDALHDQSQVAAFELNLDEELRQIRLDFASGKFRPRPIRLLPQPKRPDSAGKPRMRQSFQISVRDQIAWIAITNVVGPSLDQQMPAWSYGHRLYRAAWYDENDQGLEKLNIGPYRHTNSNLYRKFKHSWPLFRRHISLTARKMATGKIDKSNLDHGDRQALEHAIEFSRATDRLSYLEDGYWSQSQDAKEQTKIYYASFDLEKFYPQISPASILRALDQTLLGFIDDLAFRNLVACMLEFEVDTNGLSETLLASVDPPTTSGKLDGLPTGLMVAGFLANVAMLPVDKEVEETIHQKRNFAQFRFVDDHSILAFNFDTLLEQIRSYGRLLEKLKIGPRIAEDKYDPAELADLIKVEDVFADSSGVIYKQAKSDCQVDGRRPNKLLTRTLAQVSILAATDFDTLTDDSKLQRLEQLEWLLLANIPEREVRADTRAAFAAGRIATLAPTIYSSDLDLVKALRRRASATPPLPGDAPSAEDLQIREQIHNEEARWREHCGYYASLLCQAFVEHPDKVRLLIRVLDYGRTTGFDVLKILGEWMAENATGPNFLLKRYLSALTLHVLSKHLVRAACDQSDGSLLNRQNKAASEFIDTVLSLRTAFFIDARGILSQQPEFFQIDALAAFCVGLRSAATLIRSLDDRRADRLDQMAETIFQPGWHSNSSEWRQATGSGIGVWVHWAQSLMSARIDEPTSIWVAARTSHDPNQRSDWNSLRRFPKYLPSGAWAYLRKNPSILADDDGGWLLDAARAAPPSFEQIKSSRKPFKQVVRFLGRAQTDFVRLSQWANFARALDPNDPRAGEWTALEITRQILAPSLVALSTHEKTLDSIHPENIVVPSEWIRTQPQANQSERIWTWENWQQLMRRPSKLIVLKQHLDDYRLHPVDIGSNKGSSRLRCLAQILWGLLRHNFSYPTIWNIRGEERAVVGILRKDLEHLRISSATLAILEACLSPRSRETTLFSVFPGFFGSKEPNDILLDPPTLITLNDFNRAILFAQKILERSQVTVLNHQPRQLIPVSIGQLAKSAFAIEAEPGEEI